MYYNCNCVIFGTILAAFRVECVLNILDFKCQRCVSSFWCVFGPCCVVCDIFLIFNMIKTKSLPVTSKCWFICSIYIDHVWWSATCSSKCPGFFFTLSVPCYLETLVVINAWKCGWWGCIFFKPSKFTMVSKSWNNFAQVIWWVIQVVQL